jgi:hypothetical protein
MSTADIRQAEAAQFVSEVTGENVTKDNFNDALKSGVILCK